MIDEAIAIDTETTGLRYYDHNQVFAIGALSPKHTFIHEWDVEPTKDERVSKVIYTDGEKKVREFLKTIGRYRWWTFHNAKFDIIVLDRLIEELFGEIGFFSSRLDRVRCTYIMGHAFDNLLSNTLDFRAKFLLDYECPEDDELTKRTGISRGRLTRKGLLKPEVNPINEGHAFYWCNTYAGKNYTNNEGDLTVVKRYLEADIKRTYLLDLNYSNELKSNKTMQNAVRLNMDLMPAVISSENRGLYVRESMRAAMQDDTAEKARKAEIAAQKIAGKSFNLGSVQHELKGVMIDKLEFPIIKTTKTGEASLDKHVMEDYLEMFNRKDEPFNDYFPKNLHTLTGDEQKYFFTKAVMLYRVYSKMSSQIEGYQHYLDPHKRLHPQFKICGPRSFRLACATPNLQQIGNEKSWGKDETKFVIKSVKSVFSPAPGELMYAADYSQLQLWIFAWESGEKAMIEALLAGYDFHDFVATDLYGEGYTKEQRRVAKAINFGYIFGAREKKILQTCGDPEAFSKYSKLYPEAQKYMKSVQDGVKRKGYVEFKSGGDTYRLYVERNKAYKGVNYIVQGKEGVLVKKAWKRCHDYLSSVEDSTQKTAGVACQVHDEFWFSFDKKIKHKLYMKKTVEAMRSPCMDENMPVPVKVEIIYDNVAKAEAVKL